MGEVEISMPIRFNAYTYAYYQYFRLCRACWSGPTCYTRAAGLMGMLEICLLAGAAIWIGYIFDMESGTIHPLILLLIGFAMISYLHHIVFYKDDRARLIVEKYDLYGIRVNNIGGGIFLLLHLSTIVFVVEAFSTYGDP